MPSYNMGYLYNASGEEGGAFYNTDYRIVINIKEVIGISENISKLLATYALNDRPFSMYETLVQSAIYGINDTLPFSDIANYSNFFSLTDKFGITDDISALLVLATLYEEKGIIDEVKALNNLLLNEDIVLDENISIDAILKIVDELGMKDLDAILRVIHILQDKEKFIDEVKSINQILINEGFSVGEKVSIDTLISVLDRYGMQEAISDIEILFRVYESPGITDRTPRSAISDFIIGATGDFDTAYDWFIPFNMKVDWNTTSIQAMPEASNTIIEMPGIDGSIIEDTVYKDRLFQIVAFSEDGLTKTEKEELKSKITEILDSTKHQSRKLTVQANDNSFDVKYDGQAVIAEGPSYVKATIPFRTTPYGHKTFEGELYGSGLVYNDGDAPVGAKHVISGPVSNPSFTFGSHEYLWAGDVPAEYNLVIDQQMMTCYLQDKFGTKKNAMSSLSGTFQKIPAHSSVALTVTEKLEDRIYTTWRDMVLW